MKINADGSADLYFGPERPVGAVNWIRTVPVDYSPTEEFFKKTWKPGDIEKIK